MTGSGQRSFHPVTSFNLGRSATRGVVAHGPRASRRARPRVSCAAMLQLTALLLVAQIQLPPPRGYVNDFAGVLDSAAVAILTGSSWSDGAKGEAGHHPAPLGVVVLLVP